ncbi:MAG: HvfC/BufC N-terminal domain-containing protein [Hoeflea sp.]|uniref:HvfC/BufC N-terminal domain-containing protein n=1 Tax=Hoeflea sp. TaxID=1940281 RepID=UPI003EF8A35E
MQHNDAANEHEQREFGAALLDPDLPLPKGIVGPQGKAAQKRFAVYRNNVTVGLISALADIFPAIERLVGEAFFRDMARLYIAEEPPRSAVMFEYGSGFAAFLEGFEPVSDYPYLPDVARLEKAWLAAFHSADADPLQPDALGAIPPGNLSETRFTIHPATHIVQSGFAAVSIFSASREERPLEDIKPATPEDGLITRPFNTVEVRQLPPGAAEFFNALITGATLGEAADQTLVRHPGFDLPSAISAMLEAGVFTACSAGQSIMEQVT